MGMYPKAEARKEYILCAAIYVNDRLYHEHQPLNIQEGYVILGRRHHNCFQVLSMVGRPWKLFPNVQGFLTSKDRFLNRTEAAELARTTDQIEDPTTDTLFSEDLY